MQSCVWVCAGGYTDTPDTTDTTDNPCFTWNSDKQANKVIHNPVNNLACTFHIMRYPLKRGITILEGIGRVEGKNAAQAVLVRFRGGVNKLKKS